jgi:hypothetical protein
MKTSIVLSVLMGVAANQKDKKPRKNSKRSGELSEAAFLLKAKRLRFLVVKPWGDSDRYDFILCNVWYVFPMAVLASHKTLRFYPNAAEQVSPVGKLPGGLAPAAGVDLASLMNPCKPLKKGVLVNARGPSIGERDIPSRSRSLHNSLDQACFPR